MLRWIVPNRRAAPQVTLYSRSGCPLCREAEHAVRRVFGARNVDVIDIIGDLALEDLFVFRVPVLVVGGQVLAEGRITMSDARSARQTALAEQRSSERS